MLAENNLVRKMAACETMGGADNICSDKTGTLTLNEMFLEKFLIGRKIYDVPAYSEDINGTRFKILDAIPENNIKLWEYLVCVNTNTYLTPKK